jgi:hypothetical protein
MDRGQPERPADGSDEAIEAIDAVGAPADDDVSDEPIERGPSNEVPSSSLASSGRPPAHWLAYVRARAPWLITRDGELSAATRGPTPDVVPHGPATHAPPWPAAETPAPDRGSAEPAWPEDADIATVPLGGAGDRLIGQEPVRDHGPGQAPGADRPDMFPAPPRPVGGDGPVGPPRFPDPPARREDVTFGTDPAASAGSFAAWSGMPSAAGDRDERDQHQQPRSDSPERVGAGRDAPAAEDQVAATAKTPEGRTGTDEAASRLPRDPLPDWPSVARPAVSWSAFTSEPSPGMSGTDAPWPTTWGSTPGESRSEPPIVSPGKESVAGSVPPAFPPLSPSSPADHPTTDAPRPDGWRVRATAPDVWTVAQLDLQPWPDLPDPMPEATPMDDTDWRSIERRLDRIARLDREQRRR